MFSFGEGEELRVTGREDLLVVRRPAGGGGGVASFREGESTLKRTPGNLGCLTFGDDILKVEGEASENLGKKVK